MVDGAVLAREGELAGLKGLYCHRCGRDPALAHGHSNFFCPGFASFAEVGRWIPSDAIFKAFEKVYPRFLRRYGCRMEYTEGPCGMFHRVVGLRSIDGREYLGRFDHPFMPEFSLWAPREPHDMLFKGWRIAIEEFLKATHNWESRGIVEGALGISLAPTTETNIRRKIGFL